MQPSIKNRILTYDYLRGLAIILMVVGHSIIVYPVNINAIPWCHCLYNWIYTFHMPLLFFVSGCVYKMGELKPYITKKVNRILVPYVFWGAVIHIAHSLGSSLVNKHSDISTIFSNMLLGYSNWFLFTILMIFIIFPLLKALLRSQRNILIVALGIMVFVPSFFFPTVFQLCSVVHYLPFFMLGYCAKELFRRRYSRKALLTTAAACLALHTVVFILTYEVPTETLYSMRNLKAVLMIACLSCVFICYEQHATKTNALVGRSLAFVQQCSIYSLQIFLFNGFWLVLGRTVLCKYCHLTSPLPLILLLSAFNLAMSYYICKYVVSRSRLLSWLSGMGMPTPRKQA